MIGFDIERIIMVYYKHYAKPGACMILYRIRQHNSLFNNNSFKGTGSVLKNIILWMKTIHYPNK